MSLVQLKVFASFLQLLVIPSHSPERCILGRLETLNCAYTECIPCLQPMCAGDAPADPLDIVKLQSWSNGNCNKGIGQRLSSCTGSIHARQPVQKPVHSARDTAVVEQLFKTKHTLDLLTKPPGKVGKMPYIAAKLITKRVVLNLIEVPPGRGPASSLMRGTHMREFRESSFNVIIDYRWMGKYANVDMKCWLAVPRGGGHINLYMGNSFLSALDSYIT